jgi:recombination protein RecT
LSGNIQPARERAANVCTMLEQKLAPVVAANMPKIVGTSPERFMAICYAAIRMTPALAECTAPSLMTAIIRAAQAGLELDGVHGALVPFSDHGTKKATFVPMYPGLIRMALNSGVVSSVRVPRLVYDGDFFEYEYGLDEKLRHRPKPEADNQTDAQIVAGYCIVTLVSGEMVWQVTPRRVFDATKERSRAKHGPWSTDFAAMCMKTTVRHTLKYVVKRGEQAELQRVIAADEKFDAGIAPAELPLDSSQDAQGGLDMLTEELTAEKAQEEAELDAPWASYGKGESGEGDPG